MDVNKGPLRKAQENICAYKMEEQIETRLSDGFSALKVQEVQSAVIAGMGGCLLYTSGVFYIIKERIYDVKDILRIVCKGIISGQVKVPQKFRGI